MIQPEITRPELLAYIGKLDAESQQMFRLAETIWGRLADYDTLSEEFQLAASVIQEFTLRAAFFGNRERDFRDIICDNCKQEFHLRWNDYDDYVNSKETPITLVVSSCESGGVYSVVVKCPHCQYKEDV